MSITVTSQNVDTYIGTIKRATETACAAVSQCTVGGGLPMLYRMKFEKIGCEPLAPEVALNLVEQINQTFTCLVSFAAAKALFQIHPSLKELNMNIGNTNGTDILGEFQDDRGQAKSLACEVFAAVHPDNNRKLAKDVRNMRSSAADFKYVFFFSPGYKAGPLRETDGVKIHVVDLSE